MSAAIVEAFVTVKYTGNSQLTELLSFKNLALGCDETLQQVLSLMLKQQQTKLVCLLRIHCNQEIPSGWK